MNKEIIDYFNLRGLQVHKLVTRGPGQVHKDKILMAMSDIYSEINGGRDIPNIMLAREVWRKAFDYTDKDMEQRLVLINNHSLIAPRCEVVIKLMKVLIAVFSLFSGLLIYTILTGGFEYVSNYLRSWL